MPYIDSQLFDKKGVKRTLTLVLSEGEPILGSIKAAMAQHSLKEASVDGVSGSVKEATVNFMNGSKYECKILRNTPLLVASGNFKLSFDELYGRMDICAADKKPLSATLVKGNAAEGLEIKLGFIEILDN